MNELLDKAKKGYHRNWPLIIIYTDDILTIIDTVANPWKFFKVTYSLFLVGIKILQRSFNVWKIQIMDDIECNPNSDAY